MTALRRLNSSLYSVTRAAICLLLVVISVTVFANVLARYVFQSPFIWAEEASVFALVWAVMLGTALGVRDRAHLVADLLPHTLPNAVGLGLELFADALVVVIALTFIVFGLQFADLGWRRFSFSTGMPMFYVFVSMPIAGVLMTIFTLENVIDLFAAKGRPA